jgi:hypothetical protein
MKISIAVRVQVSKAPLNFPPYAMTLDPSKERILVAGGGGDSKTGVPNRIVRLIRSRAAHDYPFDLLHLERWP